MALRYCKYHLMLLIVLTVCLSLFTISIEASSANLRDKRKLVVKRGLSKQATECIACHSQKTPGIVSSWKKSKMAHASVSCFDCHIVGKHSSMSTQCSGLKGSRQYISPMVSSKTCSRCHPQETEEFLESGHGKRASSRITDKNAAKRLMYYYEGGEFIGNIRYSKSNRAPKATGCQKCHGTAIELGPDHKPINETWPGGVGTRYPDGGVGNCIGCHGKHSFSIAEARKPESCAACHKASGYPAVDVYQESKHGKKYRMNGQNWQWDSAPDTWEPGDFEAPVCSVCHMSGTGDFETTHNVNERLKWNLAEEKTTLRKGIYGGGNSGEKKMISVCNGCHGTTHIQTSRTILDNTVELYNKYMTKAKAMKNDLRGKGLLAKDPWNDGFQELYYYFWHHTGRRARQGAAMNGAASAHADGFFLLFQQYKDMEAIYQYRLKESGVEPLSGVYHTGNR